MSSSPKITIPLLERAALSMSEFAGLFGKRATWAHELEYAGKLKVIKTVGRKMVPRSEVQRIMNSAK